jgi:hypothetical protein
MRFLKITHENQRKRRKLLRKKNKKYVEVFNNLYLNSEFELSLSRHCHILWNQFGGRREYAKSFWIGVNDEPSCILEKFAQDCGKFHCGDDYVGAEYWVQHREGPVNSSEQDHGLEFHFDKDEIAMKSKDIWRHPYFSTVTYLKPDSGDSNNSSTEWGAPIVIFLTKSIELPHLLKPIERLSQSINPSLGWVCFPQPGVHVRFQGNLLHGVPSDLNPLLFREGSYHRTAIAVNLWKKSPPQGLSRISKELFPDNRISGSKDRCFAKANRIKLKKIHINQRKSLRFGKNEESHAPLVEYSVRDHQGNLLNEETHILREHLEGDTGVIPIGYLRNHLNTIKQKLSNCVGIKMRYGLE